MSKRSKSVRRNRSSPVVIEAVEGRVLMSAGVMQPAIEYARRTDRAADTTTYTAGDGLTPDAVRTAYGFAGLTFAGGTVAATGAGQTIAIVDAYNDPNIQADLRVFDAQLGVAAPPAFKVVNQTGGNGLPTTDASWAGEIALDVEWAHAIAPGANILLVEAASDSTDDLLAAVNYARRAAGVSAVSLSWGGSEFEASYQGGETSQQTTYDATFTTPAGHQGVTFVSAAGDTGQQAGVQWPASSPNVVSVGGTSLTLNADNTVAAETGWSGTSSGYSTVETEPSYQLATSNTRGERSVADVSYDGDPDTGFAVYDSLADQGYAGWQQVGGTSAGSPQWAALVAIANQGRTLAGAGTLEGATQTLPDLYALYAAPTDAAGYAAYTTAFNDVTTGGAGTVHFRHGGGGQQANSAAAGYDVVTGLGTPKAAALIADLATAAADTNTSTAGGGTTGGTTGSGSTADQTVSPVTVSITNTLPGSVVGSSAGVLKLRLTNTADATFAGPVTIALYASTDATLSTETDTPVTTVTLTAVQLRAGASRAVTLRFTYPAASAAADDYLVVQADAHDGDVADTFATAAPVTVAPPTADLSVGFVSPTALVATPGRGGRAALRLANLGNVTSAGTVVVDLYASTTDTTAGAVLLRTVTRHVRLTAGRSTTFVLAFKFPADAVAGTTTLIATIAPNTTPPDALTTDDTATLGTQA